MNSAGSVIAAATIAVSTRLGCAKKRKSPKLAAIRLTAPVLARLEIAPFSRHSRSDVPKM